MHAVEHYIVIELVNVKFSFLIKLLFILLRPPVAEVAAWVELPAFVIKAMRYLMPYRGCACISVNDCIVGKRIRKIRNDKGGCRKNNFIIGWIVVGIISLR